MVARTNSKIACFAGPSFQDGSKSPAVAGCAGADTGRSGPDNVGSNASVESRTRRLTPEQGAIGFMFDSDVVGNADAPWGVRSIVTSCPLLGYCPSRCLIISWIFFFTASRLKEAGSCIGG